MAAVITDVTGDLSTPYSSWKEFEKAVEEGREYVPPLVDLPPNEKYAFSVDEALDSINLKFNGYMPSEDALNFFNIIRLVMGEDPEVDNGLMHYFLVDLIFGHVKRENFPYSKEINETIRINPRKIAIIASRFSAKALALDSKVYTPTGHTTIRDIKVGDEVLDRNGKKCNVLAKSPVFNKETYKMTLADGREITMSGDHENIIWKRCRPYKGKWPSSAISTVKGDYGYGMVEEVVTAKELYERGVTTKRIPIKEGFNDKEYKFYIPLAGHSEIFDYEEKEFGMDPYTAGVILGDGYIDPKTGQPRITYHKSDSYHYIEHIPYEFGKEVRKILPDGTKTDCYSTCLRHIAPTVKKWLGINTSYDKRVPEALLNGSYYQRIEVLKGLMDTDGSVYKDGYCSFTSTSKGLAEDVQHLVRSTGGSAFITETTTGSSFGKAWSVRIKTNKIIFKLKRKAERQRFKSTSTRIAITKIEKVDNVPTQCISVSSPTKSFLTDGFTVTHNSTIITAFMPIYVAVTGKIPNFGDVMFWVSFGDSQQAGAKVQANTIRDICQDSQFCKEYFEKMRFTDEECEFIRRGDGPEKKRAFMFKVKGAAGGSVRGIRYKTERPQIFTFDDIIKNEADANSEVIMAKLKSMIYSDAENATGKRGKIIIVNTPFTKKDPVYTALESGVWTPICIPVCEKIYLGMPKEEYVGSWESMKSFEDIMEKYEDAHYGGTLREFNQELMLRISSEEDRMIKDDMIQWYDRKMLVQTLHGYNLVITTDFTTTSEVKSDFSGIALWAVSHNMDYFLLDLSLKKLSIQEQYNELFRMVSYWRTGGRDIQVGIEVDGQQKAHLFALKEMMIKKNLFFNFARQKGAPISREGILSKSGGTSKHERFRFMLPYFQNRKFWFPNELKDTPDMKEALKQLKYTTYVGFASHDDFNDLVSQLGMMDILPPAYEEIERRRDEYSSEWWGDDLISENDNENTGSTIF